MQDLWRKRSKGKRLKERIPIVIAVIWFLAPYMTSQQQEEVPGLNCSRFYHVPL